MTTRLDKVLYTARTHAIGGREGVGRSDDGRIDVKLSSPGGRSWASACPPRRR